MSLLHPAMICYILLYFGALCHYIRLCGAAFIAVIRTIIAIMVVTVIVSQVTIEEGMGMVPADLMRGKGAMGWTGATKSTLAGRGLPLNICPPR